MVLASKELIYDTTRALLTRSHGGMIKEIGATVLLVLGNSDQGELYTMQGGKNSWLFRCKDGREFRISGDPSRRRITVWPRENPNKRLYFKEGEGKKFELWHRHGCVL